MAAPAPARATDLSFDAQCPLLLAQADNFAHACLANAQSVTRYFNYAPETHSAFVGPATPSSHFGLGCTLDEKRQLVFVEIYYTIKADNFQRANSAPLAAVDFNGNFSLLIEHELVNFIALRPFHTKVIPLVDWANSSISCDKKPLPPGVVEDMGSEDYFIKNELIQNKIMLNICLIYFPKRKNDQCDPVTQYLEIVQGSGVLKSCFVIDIGYINFLIRKQEFDSDCPVYYQWQSLNELLQNSIDLFQEACTTIASLSTANK